MATQERKKAALLKLLAGGIAMVHLDARAPGVRVPDEHRTNGHLRLKLSYKYDRIEVLVDWYRVAATLHFPAGGFYRCILPWDAIFATTGQAPGEGEVWTEDMPPDVLVALAEKKDEQDEQSPVEVERPPPKLRIVH